MKKFCTLFTDSAQELRKIRTITACGVFAALAFLLESFAVQVTPSIKIGFSGLPNEVVDLLFGPVAGSFFAGMLDILKLIVQPTGGWIPGLTLNAFLAGLIYGCFFYKKPISFWRILLAKLIVAIFLNAFLGTFWLAQAGIGKGFAIMFPTRLVKNLTMCPINSLVLYLVLKTLETAGIFKMMKIFIPKRKSPLKKALEQSKDQ